MTEKIIKIKNKKAISEMISYVLLIIIAVTLSVGVYAWLKVYVTQQEIVECPAEASVVIKDYCCDTSREELKITFQNKGTFDISGVYIKIANTSSGTTVYLPEPKPSAFGPSEPGFFYFSGVGLVAGKGISEQEFDYSEFNQVKKVQIQPFVLRKNKIGLCEQATITQEIDCEQYPC